MSGAGASNAVELVGDDLRDPHWFRLQDPLRFWKFHDGLKSTTLPVQPLDESLGLGGTQDLYVSRAVRLLSGGGRKVHVTLFGRDANRYLMNGEDGIDPSVEYRWAPVSAPDVWTTWAIATALPTANGANFRISITDDTAFKLQLRVKGAVVGVAALQYSQLGSTEQLSGTRTYTAAISTGETHKVALPFGQTFSSNEYRILVNAYASSPSAVPAGGPGLDVVHVERFFDHAVAHLTRSSSIGSTDWTIDWNLDLGRYAATSDEGFGDLVV
jgi:hypothetical protein